MDDPRSTAHATQPKENNGCGLELLNQRDWKLLDDFRALALRARARSADNTMGHYGGVSSMHVSHPGRALQVKLMQSS